MPTRLNRRRFLQTSTAAAGGVLAGPYILRGADEKKLRIALIGVGGRGVGHHGWAGKEQITALCDVDSNMLSNPRNVFPDKPGKADKPAKAKKPRKGAADILKKFPGAKKYQDYRELFDHADDFDTVVIATPDHHHYPAAIRALRAGKAVFCEKPLTWSFWEAQRLAAEAEKNKLPTQMGNQGMASSGWRVAHAYVEGGAVGELKEAHCWTPHGSHFSTGIPRPAGSDPVPNGLDWDLWIGPAPMRPYKKGVYHPKAWRGWVDFGGGALGDWCCHLFNAMFKIFSPPLPASVECVQRSPFNGESFPDSKTIKWSFPAAGGRGAFDAYWYDGGKQPPRPPELEKGRKLGTAGALLIGTKGTVLIQGGHNNSAILIPETKRKAHGKPKIVAPKSRGHNTEFVMAAKGQIPYNAPLSHFAYGAHLTGVCLLGNIAMQVGGKLKFDPETLKFTNSEKANRLLTRKPRPGWYV